MAYQNPVRVMEIPSPYSAERRVNVVVVPAESYTFYHRRMVLLLGMTLMMIAMLVTTMMPRLMQAGGAALALAAPVAQPADTQPLAPAVSAAVAAGAISPVFAPSVHYWADQIVAWSAEQGVDPNMAAIIMQIESCGDPQAVSVAGAQGLFQVMPFHFTAGENSLDPDTNARRGLAYFAERLVQTNGDVGRAFAGYNGGHVAAAGSWDTWAHETQRYYVWATGIHNEISQGLSDSPTLNAWMEAGGASLCRQAAERLGI